MVLKVNGLKNKSNPKFVIGYTDIETVKLDFDDTPLRTVKYWAFKIMKRFSLKGFVILKSSDKNYHVVFDRKVSWKENVKIMAWASLLINNGMLQKWFVMQCIKEGSTLRMSPKGEKNSPRIVFRYGEQNDQIPIFLKYRKLVKTIIPKTFILG